MREILFRGKDADTGFWCYGDLSFDREKNPYIRFWTHTGYLVRKVLPETVGQFTGFYDKNNRRIFEGDILKSIYPDEPFEDSMVYERVFWDNGWYIKEGISDPSEIWQEDMTRYSEIAGNIYENADLLEVEE